MQVMIRIVCSRFMSELWIVFPLNIDLLNSIYAYVGKKYVVIFALVTLLGLCGSRFKLILTNPLKTYCYN